MKEYQYIYIYIDHKNRYLFWKRAITLNEKQILKKRHVDYDDEMEKEEEEQEELNLQEEEYNEEKKERGKKRRILGHFCS